MKLVRYGIMAAALVLLLAPATAQERPAPGPVGADATAVDRGGARGDTGDAVLGWNWYRPQRTWNYWNGSTWILWMDMRGSSDVIWIDSNASDRAPDQLNLAAMSGNWLGIKWTSSSSWSDSQLWYY